MTGQEYDDIAAAADRLLRAPDTSLARLAIPSLHVVDEHPGCTARYEPLPDGRHPSAGARPLLSFAGCAMTAIRAGRALARALRPRPETSAPPSDRFDVLIVSRLLNPSQLERQEDFYFGDLQRLLRERGLTSLLVFVNHLPRGSTPHALHGADTFPPRRVLPRTAPAWTELGIWRECASAWRRLRRTANRSTGAINRVVARLACRHLLQGAALSNLRLHAAVSHICRLASPSMVVTTYEGDASERLIWHAARNGKRRPLCVGYQHTRLLPRAHAIRRAIRAPGLDCDPDVILTLGKIPHQRLTASPALGAVRLITYGSHRRTDSGRLTPTGERPQRCLVLPDGEESERRLLFDFATECARLMPQMVFVLRPHPATARAATAAATGTARDRPANIIFSPDKTLGEECALARYCLYRSSSAAIHAVLAGVKPFYLARAGELPLDTLHGLDAWRETIHRPTDFHARVLAAEASTDMHARLRAWEYCDRYISRVRPGAIDELLDDHHADTVTGYAEGF